ncbi:MAG TPA: ABC transporter permease subunit [Steroidobacter sp.]|uniref:ABC transporter permease n=1 Tax=Steroidobacter sp. TaxID=1978227 RepID=UPI002EDB6457
MKVLTLAAQEVRVGLRNRWVLATTVVMAALALSLTLLGSAPTGTVKADPLAVVVVSLASLTIFLVPLIALLLSFDTIVGEQERGTLMLLLSYPVSRWQIVLGKGLGQVAILAIATVLGYGAAGIALWLKSGVAEAAWQAYAAMVLTSIMLGATFVAMGCLASVLVRERATAAGLAVGIWLFFVLLYDTALLGVLVADQGRIVGKSVLDALLLLNPADAYRLFNMTASESVSVYSGMAGPGDPAALPPLAYVGVLALWIAIPLAIAIAAFRRRAL